MKMTENLIGNILY